MSNNQPPIGGESHQQESIRPKKVKFTNQLFPPRLNLASGASQIDPLPGNNSSAASFSQDINPTDQPLSHEAPYAHSADDITIPFKSTNSPGNFFGGKGYNGLRDTTTGQLDNPGTGALTQAAGQYNSNTGMLTLNQAVKVVKIPIAGKPGEFKTGILPVISQTQTGTLPPPSSNGILANRPKHRSKLILLVALIFLMLLGSSGYYLLQITSSTALTTKSHSHTITANVGNSKQGQTNNPAATAAFASTATTVAETSLVIDSLSYPSRSWVTGEDTASKVDYFFKNGAYHIRPDGDNFGYALLPGIDEVPNSYIYNLTMANITYDTGNTNNLSFYAMVLNCKNYGNNKASFYMFRVNNGAHITYEFDKYDNRTTKNGESPWQQLFPSKDNMAGTNGKANGKEFIGPHWPNTYSVSDKNGTFTLSVNGTKIGTSKDTTLTGGQIGMAVSQAKTEVAFSNLSLLSN
ncbi:hypothetical protein [Dictyobacter arantiisoli]|uniref:Uncharacterized protein n=1 Tax=Dictyobacter arantiisoli TaxID=2014874 RepID=A0A5A5TD48_9CHLR|nr:hypothetical protein [Dictyobacter arantiisoli]GCF09267.1 hypothetical protein KDI_28310 [Dictyobacter arantiisoli]